MSPPRGEAGFTLIEMMVSLALFGLIATAGLALVSGVLGIETRTGGRLDRIAELQRAMYVLTLDIEQVADADVSGGGDVLRFSRHAAALGGAAVPLGYRLDGDRISRTPDAGPGAGGAQPLLRGVSALRWRFYAPGAGWIERWPPPGFDRRTWPAAIEARIVLTRDETGPAGVLRRVVALPARP